MVAIVCNKRSTTLSSASSRCHPELDSGSILANGANSTVLGNGRWEILNQVQDDNGDGCWRMYAIVDECMRSLANGCDC